MKLLSLVVLAVVIISVATFFYYWTFLSVSITDLEHWKGLLYIHFWVHVRKTPINVTFDITVHVGDRVIHHVYETRIFIPVLCNLTESTTFTRLRYLLNLGSCPCSCRKSCYQYAICPC